jgi:hypothetical protein
MLTRCADGKKKTAPRELIQLLNCIKDEEIKRLERGERIPPDGNLFDRSVFKKALPEVSRTRLNSFLYAEYHTQRPFLEALADGKAEQTPDSLARIWSVPQDDALRKAYELVDLGFFEARGDRAQLTFWVPFLYRDALHLTQGRQDD